MGSMHGLLIILNIVYILLQCTHYMDADCFTKQYNIFPSGYNIFIQSSVQPVFKSVEVADRFKCGKLCALETFCHIWRYGHGNCQIFHSMKDKFTVNTSASSGVSTYYETAEGEVWLKVYFVKNQTWFEVGESFLGTGIYKSWGPAACTKSLCPDLFRNNLIDVWSYLPIDKVKISARTDNKEVVSILFDGKSTTKKDWFSMSRVLESPWTDMHKSAPYKYFSLDGYSFYAPSDGSPCPSGCGWFIVIDYYRDCPGGNYNIYPKIMYSNISTCTNWTTGYALAEEMFIYVSLK